MGEEIRNGGLQGGGMTSMFRRHPRGRPPHPDVLTPAEWRVLDEVRDGRSNPEIAERLGLSRNTVKTHVSSILDKLELRDRSDLAVWQGRPAHARRSLLFAPLAWLTSRGEVVVASAVATVVAVGLVVAMQSGVLTDTSDELSVMPVGTATEVVATPPAATAIPDCPVLHEVCALAVEFLPLMRTADGQAIAARSTTQTLACSDVVPIWEDSATVAQLIPLCEEAPPRSTVEVYEFHTGKGPNYFTSPVDFADMVSSLRDESGSAAPPRIVAVGCGSEEGLPPDCARGAIAVYAYPRSAPATPVPTVTPPPSATGGKPLVTTPMGPEPPGFMTLIFSRSNETGLWHVEKLWGTFPGSVAWPILYGQELEIFTGGGIQEVNLFSYDFG